MHVDIRHSTFDTRHQPLTTNHYPMTNLHTHSTWCDGKDTPEKIILAAIDKGFDTLGFSSHAMLPGDPFDWPLTKETIALYAAEIRALAKKYASDIKILSGVEADYIRGVSSPDRSTYFAVSPDYIIGSVHYVIAEDGAWVSVDESPESLRAGIDAHFHGDARSFISTYFAAQREMVQTCDFDIIGHPDLCRKFNAKLHYYDENADWYLAELESTAKVFAASGKTVEINTGGMARGWTTSPYPSERFLSILKSMHVPLILSSDAHTADTLDFGFSKVVGG